jgi:hypothetical protein
MVLGAVLLVLIVVDDLIEGNAPLSKISDQAFLTYLVIIFILVLSLFSSFIRLEPACW